MAAIGYDIYRNIPKDIPADEVERWAETCDAVLLSTDRASAASKLGLKTGSLYRRLSAYRKRPGFNEFLAARRDAMTDERLRLRESNQLQKERLMSQWMDTGEEDDKKFVVQELNRLEPQRAQVQVHQDIVQSVQHQEVPLTDAQYSDLESAIESAERLASGQAIEVAAQGDDASGRVRTALQADEQTVSVD